VVFDLLWNMAGKRTRMAMRITGNLLVGGLAAVAVPATWDYVHFMQRESTPVLGISFMWVFMPFVILMAALVLRSVWAIVGTLRGQGLQTELHLS
jgi:TRAP-type C4-dicarboxylate transport system permease small subunit